MSENRYINLVKISQEIIIKARVPLRSSIFSKKKFNQHQLDLLVAIFSEDFYKPYIWDELLQQLDLVGPKYTKGSVMGCYNCSLRLLDMRWSR